MSVGRFLCKSSANSTWLTVHFSLLPFPGFTLTEASVSLKDSLVFICRGNRGKEKEQPKSLLPQKLHHPHVRPLSQLDHGSSFSQQEPPSRGETYPGQPGKPEHTSWEGLLWTHPTRDGQWKWMILSE